MTGFIEKLGVLARAYEASDDVIGKHGSEQEFPGTGFYDKPDAEIGKELKATRMARYLFRILLAGVVTVLHGNDRNACTF